MDSRVTCRLEGQFRGGTAWEITCRRLLEDERLLSGTSRRAELVEQMFRLERREELRGLLSYLYKNSPQTHEFTIRRQTSRGWAVLHQSSIHNKARYKHKTQFRAIGPKEIAQGICATWQFLLHDDDGKPHPANMEFAVPGETAWMFWAGALIRSYYEFTHGGVIR